MYTLQEKEEDLEEGKLNLRMLKINRTVALDAIRELFKEHKLLMGKTDKSDTFKNHYTSLKRVQLFIKDELVFSYQKSDGEDHMMFSLMYLYLAIKLRGRVHGWVSRGSVPLVSSYVVKQNVTAS
jgi:hypothetical protein